MTNLLTLVCTYYLQESSTDRKELYRWLLDLPEGSGISPYAALLHLPESEKPKADYSERGVICLRCKATTAAPVPAVATKICQHCRDLESKELDDTLWSLNYLVDVLNHGDLPMRQLVTEVLYDLLRDTH